MQCGCGRSLFKSGCRVSDASVPTEPQLQLWGLLRVFTIWAVAMAVLGNKVAAVLRLTAARMQFRQPLNA